MKSKIITIAAIAAVPAIALTITTTAIASTATNRIAYHHGDDRLIVRGDGCLQAEDMTRLKLIHYVPSENKIVYRCIQP